MSNLTRQKLVSNCIRALNRQLRVIPLQYIVQSGVQREGFTDEQLRSGEGFKLMETRTEYENSIHSVVKSDYSVVTYDLVGKVAENTQLTRGNDCKLFLSGSNPQYLVSINKILSISSLRLLA